MKAELLPYFTFEKIRGRTLVWCYVFTTIISTAIYSEIHPIIYNDKEYRLPSGIYLIFFYSVFILIISSILFRSRLSYRNLFGKFPDWSTLRWYSLLTIPLLLFSLCTICITYIFGQTLSLGFTEWWFEEDAIAVVYPSTVKLLIANIFSIFCITIITPIFEEFFFRGILLTRWSIKWNNPKAIIFTSILFGLLHADMIGGIFFGYVLAIAYHKTKSLYVPICIHVLNNLILTSIQFYTIITNSTTTEGTDSTLGVSIWICIIGLFFVIAVMFNYLRKNIPNKDWVVPYLFHHNSENSPN